MQYVLGSTTHLPFIKGKQKKGIGFLIKKKSLLLVSRHIKKSSGSNIGVYR